MENIKSYQSFLLEGKITEKEGISPAVYNDLKKYFSEAKVPTLKGAQAYLSKVKKDGSYQKMISQKLRKNSKSNSSERKNFQMLSSNGRICFSHRANVFKKIFGIY